MCQMRVVEEKDGVEELLMEDVTQLEITDNELLITSLFDGPKKFSGIINKIDFNAGKVFLTLQQ